MTLTSDPAFTELSTLLDFIRLGAARFHRAKLFFGHGTDNAWDEAAHLVLHCAGVPLDVGRSALGARLLSEEKAQILALFQRRVQERIPAPYLIGEAWFAGLPFYIDEHVLIPRSPIVSLIETGFEPWLSNHPAERILDLCTGSGCIGIACALLFEESEVDLVDISPDALRVAEQNIERHELADRVKTIESDLFQGVQGQTYDLIVSNPPYVDEKDFNSMPAEFHHEPRLGLTSGLDGLDITRRILQQAVKYLSPEGVLVVEVGNSEVALQEAYPQVPFVWVDLERGGNGVFLLQAEELRRYSACFEN